MKSLLKLYHRPWAFLYYDIYVPCFRPDLYQAHEFMIETLLRDIGWVDRSQREAWEKERKKSEGQRGWLYHIRMKFGKDGENLRAARLGVASCRHMVRSMDPG